MLSMQSPSRTVYISMSTSRASDLLVRHRVLGEPRRDDLVRDLEELEVDRFLDLRRDLRRRDLPLPLLLERRRARGGADARLEPGVDGGEERLPEVPGNEQRRAARPLADR